VPNTTHKLWKAASGCSAQQSFCRSSLASIRTVWTPDPFIGELTAAHEGVFALADGHPVRSVQMLWIPTPTQICLAGTAAVCVPKSNHRPAGRKSRPYASSPPHEYRPAQRQVLGLLNRRSQYTQAIPGRIITGCTCIVESVTTTSKLPELLLTTTISQRSSIVRSSSNGGQSNLLGRNNLVPLPCFATSTFRGMPRDPLYDDIVYHGTCPL